MLVPPFGDPPSPHGYPFLFDFIDTSMAFGGDFLYERESINFLQRSEFDVVGNFNSQKNYRDLRIIKKISGDGKSPLIKFLSLKLECTD